METLKAFALVVIVVAIFMFGFLFLAYTVSEMSCTNLGHIQGYESKYDFMSGCFLRIEDHYKHIDTLRQLY